ncbi:hypothetical protein Agub_g8280, partial [Astrephomene gubernaculifera]
MLLNRQRCGLRAQRSSTRLHQQPLATAAVTPCGSIYPSCSQALPKLSLANCVGVNRRSCVTARAAPANGRIDVVGLGNLCVDAVLPLEELPPPDLEVRRELLDRLTASPPDPSSWEVGGNCNFMVAAARLGLRVASVGHIGGDVYGRFMDQILREEGIQETTRIAPTSSSSCSAPQQQQQPCNNHQTPAAAAEPKRCCCSSNATTTTTASTSTCNGTQSSSNGSGHTSSSHATPQAPPPPAAVVVGGGGLDSTLICFVLVDHASRHAFCSRYDFGPWPLLEGIQGLPEQAAQVLRSSRAIFTNGFIFDELPLEVVRAACEDAIRQGAAIFFDPGPRCQTMLEGPRRAALDLLLDLSAVVLMTEEEARVVTGYEDPEAAARWVLARPGARAAWAVVKMGAQGALLCARRTGAAAAGSSGHGSGNGKGDGVTTTRVGAVKVDVVDTVGC